MFRLSMRGYEQAVHMHKVSMRIRLGMASTPLTFRGLSMPAAVHDSMHMVAYRKTRNEFECTAPETTNYDVAPRKYRQCSADLNACLAVSLRNASMYSRMAASIWC